MSAATDAADVTVAICKCGAAVFMVVTSTMGKTDHMELGELIQRGCEVKHTSAVQARQFQFGCKCASRQRIATAERFL